MERDSDGWPKTHPKFGYFRKIRFIDWSATQVEKGSLFVYGVYAFPLLMTYSFSPEFLKHIKSTNHLEILKEYFLIMFLTFFWVKGLFIATFHLWRAPDKMSSVRGNDPYEVYKSEKDLRAKVQFNIPLALFILSILVFRIIKAYF